jgi:penicillin-binding protein 1C
VIKALRSPGSTLKPFLYALGMEKGLLTPKTILIDVPYDDEGFTPENYTGNFSGAVTAESALRQSLNVPMIRLLKEIGVPEFTDFLVRGHFSSLERQKEKLGLSMIVGGCGVTLEELTTAYAALANGGRWAPIQFEDATDDAPQERTIFSSSTAFMITEILAGLNRPDLPNNFESSKTFPKIAFKTGTSYGRRDAWSVGYSAEYTVGIWMGNETNRGHSNLIARKTAVPLLLDIFNAISKPNQKIIMPQPEDVKMRQVCTLSGKVPGPHCEHAVDDLYSFSQSSDAVCDLEREYMVSLDGAVSYCPSCVGSQAYLPISIPDYPSELIGYWVKNGVAVVQPPPHNPNCTRLFSGTGPKISSPSGEETYFITSEHQTIPLHASVGVDARELAWYYDEEFIGRKKADEKLFVEMKNGSHTVICRDDKGRKSTVSFIVKKAL